jgi:hypothetical protein
MSASQPDVIAVTASGPLTAGLFDDRVVPMLPTKISKVAPHARDRIIVNASPAGAGPGYTDVFEIPKLGNFLVYLSLVIEWASLSGASLGTATFLHFIDGVGLYVFDQMRVIYPNNKLQTIRPDDLAIMHNDWFGDERRATLDDMVKMNLTPAQRDLLRVKPFVTKLPIHSFLCMGDLSNAFNPHGLSQKLRIEIDYKPLTKLLQADGTFTSPYNVTTSPGSFWTNRYLECEFENTLKKVRTAAVNLSASKRGIRQMVYDFGYCTPLAPITSTTSTSLNGAAPNTSGVKIEGFNGNCHSLIILPYWNTDRTRLCGITGTTGTGDTTLGGHGTTGAGGADWNNHNGWLQPLNTPVTANVPEPMIEYLRITYGNTDLMRQTRVLDLLGDIRTRFYKGSAGWGVPAIPFGYAPTMYNANTGLVDGSLIDNPYLISTTFNTPNGYTTQGAYSAADITDTTYLWFQIIFIGYNFIDILAHDMFSIAPK